MPEPFGVVPTGYSRKTALDFLADLEAKMVAVFGQDVVQDNRSPLGQLNGLMADILAEADERIEDTYQSFDVDQADGPRLDMVAKLRRLERNAGESDGDFRLRITNEAVADIRLTANVNRLKALPGVTWASAIENATDATSALGMPAHSVAYAVIGGDDEEVGLQVYQLSVPGILLYGNTEIPVVADGYCQTVSLIRPVDVPIRVEVDIKHVPDSSNCAPPAASTITQFLIDAFAVDGYRNGDVVKAEQIEVEVARYGDIKVQEVRIARQSTLIVEDEIATTLFERPVIISPYVSVRYV